MKTGKRDKKIGRGRRKKKRYGGQTASSRRGGRRTHARIILLHRRKDSRVEEIPPAREIPRARKRCRSERGGEGRERRVVAVEEEGERELLSPRGRSFAPARSSTRNTDFFFFYSVQDRICQSTAPNRDRDRQMPILMDRRSRSGPVRLTEPRSVFVEPYLQQSYMERRERYNSLRSFSVDLILTIIIHCDQRSRLYRIR